MFASLVRLVGDFDLAEEASHEAFAASDLSGGRVTGCRPTRGRGSVSAGRFKAVDAIRRRGQFHKLEPDSPPVLPRSRPVNTDRAGREIEDDPTPTHLRLLSPGDRPGGASPADAARSVRAFHRGDCRRVPGGPGDDGPADRARKRPRFATPASRSRSRTGTNFRIAWGPCWPSSTWFQRGVLCHRRRRGHTGRPVRRGDPPGQAGRRTLADPEAVGLSGVDAFSGSPPARPDHPRWEYPATRRPGPDPVGRWPYR